MSSLRSSPRSAPGLIRRLALGFVLFGGLGVLVLLGPTFLGLKGAGAMSRFMGAGVVGPLGPLLAILGFTGLAFLGAPQFVLIGVAVLAFGPSLGFLYSWVGTLVSAAVGFGLGRRFGTRLLADHAGDKVRRFLDLVGRNGFLASFLVRLAPSAPFIMVNMAAGMTPMGFGAFLGGTAIGIVPKIAVTSFAGNAVQGGLHGGPGGLLHGGLLHGGLLKWGLFALALLAWAFLGLAARTLLKRAVPPAPPICPEAPAAAPSPGGTPGKGRVQPAG